MPSLPESGNNTVVDNKSRPATFKNSDPPKYTDVTRTSSSSFKPPMSKDPVTKNKTDVQPAESSWLGPFSYIKTMFTGKASAESAQISTNGQKNKKLPHAKNASNVKDAFDEISKRKEESQQLALCSEIISPTMENPDPSPRFNFTADEATSRRTKEKNLVKKNDSDVVVGPNAPKYSALRFVENKSTYLHTPDKKGTTSFRITTSSKVKSKPSPATNSPATGSSAKRMRLSPALSRQTSTSPKKIPQSNSNTANNFPTRLRSKSTPDHSSLKPRPVSDTTYPKSLSLKPTSHKIVPQSQNDVNENRVKVAFVNTASKFSGPNKPTILGSKPVLRHSSMKNPSRSSKSSLQIGLIPSRNSLILTRSSSMGDNRVEKKTNQDSASTKLEKGNDNKMKTPKSNIQHKRTTTKDERSIMKNSTLERKKAFGTKLPLPAESPSFTEPSFIDISKPATRISSKNSDALKKFVNAQRRARDKLKSKREASKENKLEPHHMVLPTPVKSSPLLNHTPVRVASSDSGFLRTSKSGTVKDISSTIAESPVRRPSPPGATLLTTCNNEAKNDTKEKEETKMKQMVENDQTVMLFPSFLDQSRISSLEEMEQSHVSPFGVYPVNASMSPGSTAIDECKMTLNTPIPNEAIALSYIKEGESDPISPTTSDHTEGIEENIYHTYKEYHDVSNSASGPDNYNLKLYEIDIFEEECEIQLNKCNSALPKKAVMNGKSCMLTSSPLSETDDSALYASSNKIPKRVKHMTNTSEFLPFQKNLDNEPIRFFAEQVPIGTTSTSSAKYRVARTPEPIVINREIKIDRPKSTDSQSRRSPLSFERTRAQSPKASPSKINAYVSSISPALTSSKPISRVHSSPFLKSANSPTKKNGGSNYLESIKHPAVPTVLEPTVIHENKAVPIYNGSPKLYSYKTSPDNTLTSIATSVGDALDSLTEKFKQTFPSVLNVAKSPVKSSPIETRDSSPAKPLTKPTQQITDRSFGNTATYISTMFEDSYGSPLFRNKEIEKKINKVDSKMKTKGEKEKSPQEVVIPSPPEAKILLEKEIQDIKVIEASSTEKQKRLSDSTKTDFKQLTPQKDKTTKSNSISKLTVTEPKPVVQSEVKERKTMTESIKKSIESTKNILSALFSPPKKPLQPELPKKKEEHILEKSDSKSKVISKDLSEDTAGVKSKNESNKKWIPKESSKSGVKVKQKSENETKLIPKELSKGNAMIKPKNEIETNVITKELSKDNAKVKSKSENETKVILKELSKDNTKIKPEIDVKDIARPQKTTEHKKGPSKSLTLKKSIDSDPARWPTFTKPGFAKIGGAPQEETKQNPKPEPLPPKTSPPSGPSPLSITAHSGQQKENQKKSSPLPPNTETSNGGQQSSMTTDPKINQPKTTLGDVDNSSEYQNEFNLFV